MNYRDKKQIDVSIIGPAMNEAGNLEEFVERCIQGFNTANVEGEIIIIDDGSNDGTGEVLQKLIDRYPEMVRGFAHRRRLGLTQALKTGFQHAVGDYIVWISSDLESHPDEDIPLFMEGFRQGADVVAGARTGRGDGKNVASKIYNSFCQKLFNLQLKDMNWMKGFRRECLAFLELRGDWHRFILVMLHIAGFNIVEKEMHWYSRKYGHSKFGLMRFPRSIVDAISIWFMLLFSRKPMRLFGTIGVMAGIFGILIHVALVVLYMFGNMQIRPLFWAALIIELFAVQMIMFGFVSELTERVRDDLEALRMGLRRSHQWVVELHPRQPHASPHAKVEHLNACN